MSIDNPTEKIRELMKEDDFDATGAAIQFASLALPAAKVLTIVKSILGANARAAKVVAAIISLCDEIDRVDDQLRKEIGDIADETWFKRAVVVLVEEAGRAVDEDHARLLARVAGRGCFPDARESNRQEDLASYLRDLARLGADDIQMLKIMGEAYREVFTNDPNLRDSNRFTNHNERFKRAAERANIHPDDRLALGARLSGFGLAFESVPQDEHYFRPTLRGFYLLSLLEAAELPVEKAN